MWSFCHLLLSVKLIILPVSLIIVIVSKNEKSYSILSLMIKKDSIVLGAVTVMQNVVLLKVKSALGRDITVFFFYFQYKK